VSPRIASFRLLSLLAIGLYPNVAAACRCVEPTVRQAYRRADLVVVATVEGVERTKDDVLKATVSIKRGWKTAPPSRLTFVSGEDCSYEVKVGEQHLLFLYKASDGTYGTIRCRGSKAIPAAGNSLAWLNRHAQSIPVRE
jgi:hypothetical protein